MTKSHRCWDIGSSYALDWGVKVVEGLTLNDLSANFATNTKCGESTFNNEQADKNNVSRSSETMKPLTDSSS